MFSSVILSFNCSVCLFRDMQYTRLMAAPNDHKELIFKLMT